MLFLSTLARNTPKKIIKNSLRVKIFKGRYVQADIDSDANGEFKQVKGVARDKDGQRHMIIRLYPKEKRVRGDGAKMSTGTKCWVTCSCPYWRYYCEVAVAARGSAHVLISNGQFPKIRNPRMKPYLCKHLLRFIPVATAASAKRRKVNKIEDVELDMMAKMLEPFIPKSA